MVKIKVISVGRAKESWIKEGVSHYQKLLKRYAELQQVEIKEEKITKSRPTEDIRDAEAERILKHVDAAGLTVALDQKGERLSSEELAGWLGEKLSLGHGEFSFVLGGALGLSRKVQRACSFRLSLSPMTLTHEMSLVILLEQIYRAFSILKGTNYHK
ncbi:MAG: 23S rRNA (pseudouridine(1915)-N(3))-methyltransferase RlmH [Candidatus Zixiibacteriota bacterium]|nr:MAG: 23S rRNA (pseudouridine(1915)-N(3))-methyltransferase RlmH [candidate division Zixibacteria bacterium]